MRDSAVNVAYILYNERPMSGLLRGQVIEMLSEMAGQSSNVSLTVICFWQPFIFFTERKGLNEMRRLLTQQGITVEYYFFCPPNRLFAFQNVRFRLLTLYNNFVFSWIIGDRFDVLHTRAYYAGFFASNIKRKAGFKHVFDLRSLFPDEMLASGLLSQLDQGYGIWKRVEKHVIKNSDYCIAVSEQMEAAILEIDPTVPTAVVPLCVNTKKAKVAAKSRNKDVIPPQLQNRHVIAYCGSLSINFNNDIREYARYFRAIYRQNDNVHFLIISQTSASKIQSWLESAGIEESLYTICEAKNDQLFQLLGSCEFGLLVMRPGADRESRLGVKFVEYLSAGLPVLANNHVGAAAKIINNSQLGMVIDLDESGCLQSSIDSMFSPTAGVRDRCIDFARNHFDTALIAEKYLSIYESLA